LPISTATATATATAASGISRTITYAYDGLSRLTAASESGATANRYGYAYDLAGNRTSATVNGATTTQSFNAANQVLGWSYDAAGNLLSDGTTTYTSDALGRTLTQGGTSYSYNGDGVLVQAGAIHYTQDLAAPLSQILSDGSASYVYGLDRLASSAGAWYLGDALGSVRQTLDASGAVTAAASYDPWGMPTSGMIAPFGFTGEVQDSAGQVYLRARWYNAGSGTFTSRDPFAGWAEQPYSLQYYQSSRWQTSSAGTSRADIPYTLHPYAYALSTPVLYTDPSGLCIFAVVDTLICLGGLTFTIGEAIAIVAATGVATYATYDICVAQGKCDRLATDLENALQQRQTMVSSAPTSPRDTHNLPTIPGIGGACAANIGLTTEGATQAIQAAETSLVRAEGLPRNEITILYRGTSLKSVYAPRVPLWTTPWIFVATFYTDTNAAIDRSPPVIAVYSIPTMLLRAMVASGTVRTRFAGIRGSEYGFMSAAQPFLFGPIVVPVPPRYTGY
ncbi:MAG: RHS repeat-associated core domain-containing protein, partial [Chloroflexales bacterium]|nr:RHS repeat-associated core domain-containing protein [Chloroflexales bacterium]